MKNKCAALHTQCLLKSKTHEQTILNLQQIKAHYDILHEKKNEKIDNFKSNKSPDTSTIVLYNICSTSSCI